MEHIMRLNPEPFKMIKEGRKTIELRLYDEKRQTVKPGDFISFVNNENNGEKLRVLVENLYVFDSFEELYKKLPLKDCGYENTDCARASDMEKFYSKEKQKKYGVVGIKFSKI